MKILSNNGFSNNKLSILLQLILRRILLMLWTETLFTLHDCQTRDERQICNV